MRLKQGLNYRSACDTGVCYTVIATGINDGNIVYFVFWSACVLMYVVMLCKFEINTSDSDDNRHNYLLNLNPGSPPNLNIDPVGIS